LNINLSKESKKKILFLGLDNAGKTSIYNLIKSKMVDPISIKPTRGIERDDMEILGQTLSIHDLGGQRKYRINYLKKDAFIFNETDALVYVVDLQDPNRYDLALEYFQASLEILAELELNPKIFVCLHKFDGPYKDDYNSITSRVRLEFDRLKNAFNSIAENLNFEIEKIYKTSIFNAWSCFTTFNDVWSSIVPKMQSIQAFLEELVERNPEIGMSFFLDADGHLLAKKIRYNEEIDLENLVSIAAKSILLLLDWQKSLHDEKINDSDFAIIEIDDQSIMLQKIEASGDLFYLVIYAIGGQYRELQTRFAGISMALENIL